MEYRRFYLILKKIKLPKQSKSSVFGSGWYTYAILKTPQILESRFLSLSRALFEIC
jgi:hypothetical protein